MTTVRRSAAALAASAALCVALAPAAVADDTTAGTASPSPAAASPSPLAASPSPAAGAPARLPAGLYGTKDPTRDGVWRQSLAMLGQYAAGLRPANSAILWLKSQQCADGSFPAYRPDPAVPCDLNTATDVNSTSAALQALASVGGQREFMQKAVGWLRLAQNKDGGWGRTNGAPTDANSTALVIGSLTTAGAHPGSMRSLDGKNGYDALITLAIPCDAATGAGAFAHQPGPSGTLVADNDATAAAVLGGIGKRMVAAPVSPGPAPTCHKSAHPTPEFTARNGAAYLARILAEDGHLDRSALPGAPAGPSRPDPGNTADAIVALGAAGYGDKATGALDWLKKNSASWAAANGPAAWAQLIFAAHTAGVDPHHFGGVDLVERLNATGPAPIPVPALSPSSTIPASAQAAAVREASVGKAQAALWVIAVGLVVCVGAAVYVSRRRRSVRS
ncbi:prenyltransferase/squalene oxidase repeat-containing protein [Streptomyces sp. NBC_00370]|uniref:prenyltransferase/squalene oxidase repeat-containing protein n=1 Tax=Streptomyces sp. NBC_00370 TaxID=2975728 RepID=UPI002E25A93C